jgi:DNA-3-methyladenine glycosylase I
VIHRTSSARRAARVGPSWRRASLRETIRRVSTESQRCPWAGTDPLYVRYHDEEWGVPSHDDRHLFEMLILEGAQAGLSWLTILRKREGYRRAFLGFEPERVARMTAARQAKLMEDEGIVRNRAKIASTVDNAKAFLAVQRERGSFDAYLWSFVEGGRPIQHRFESMKQVPAETELAVAMSKDLKKRGFRFVGPTIVYAYLQAIGVVNDHLVACPRWRAVQAGVAHART